MKNRGFSRFPNGFWEIWVSIQTYTPSYVQAYARTRTIRSREKLLSLGAKVDDFIDFIRGSSHFLHRIPMYSVDSP